MRTELAIFNDDPMLEGGVLYRFMFDEPINCTEETDVSGEVVFQSALFKRENAVRPKTGNGKY